MKDVLCFVNEIDFAGKLHNVCLEKLVEVKKTMMVRDFKNIIYPN